MTLREVYRSIDTHISTVYVIPRIELSSAYNPYLRLLYQDFLSPDTKEKIRVVSPHPLIPLFILKRLLGEKSIVHYHWIHFLDVCGFFVLLWKISCVLLYRLLGGHIIWSVHNKHLHVKRFLWLNIFFRRLMARSATRLHVHYHGAVHTMAQLLKVPEEKFVVIRHPLYPVSIIAKDAALEYCCNNLIQTLTTDKPVFLMYGNIGAYKDIIDVIPLITEEKGSLIIAGECKKGEHAYLEKIKEAIKNKKNIHLISRFISLKEEMNLFNAVDCVLFNFHDVLSSGSVMLALSYKKEIIAPSIDCIRELAGPGIHTFTTQAELQECIDAVTARYSS